MFLDLNHVSWPQPWLLTSTMFLDLNHVSWPQPCFLTSTMFLGLYHVSWTKPCFLTSTMFLDLNHDSWPQQFVLTLNIACSLFTSNLSVFLIKANIIILLRLTHQTGRIESRLQADPLNFKIFVTAEIAFSVGFMFSGCLLSPCWMMSTRRGTAWLAI